MILPDLNPFAAERLAKLVTQLQDEKFGTEAECAKEALRIVMNFVNEEDTFVRREQSE